VTQGKQDGGELEESEQDDRHGGDDEDTARGISHVSHRPFTTPAYVPPRPRGRPRKAATAPANGQATGTTSLGSHAESKPNGAVRHFVAVDPLTPRLLNLHSTAAYLGVSEWTVRDLEVGGLLKRICVPLPNQRELRKLLFDRADLDKVIESWKE